jgi:hypothetical protein
MIEQIHDTIRRDLIQNRKDLFNLYNYYTHKWRSNDRLLDINVGLFRNDKQVLTAQIYVADKNTKIREQLFLDENFNMFDNALIIKRLN